MAHELLDNVVWNALNGPQAALGTGGDRARRFATDILGAGGVADETFESFAELARLMERGDMIGLFTDGNVSYPVQFVLRHQTPVVQMVFTGLLRDIPVDESLITPLTEADIPNILHTVSLAQPGPFWQRTIVTGDYFSIREDGKLVAMAGERFHVDGYREIGTVCTLPGYEGRGYATMLSQFLMRRMLDREETPFLHVARDNARAISIYERLGFQKRSEFYLDLLEYVE